MKKIILLFCLSFFVLSCEKEDECVSNCGTIVEEDACLLDYCVTIQNECTNNLETFTISETDWSNAFAGDQMCITNVTSW